MRHFFMESERLMFSVWRISDITYARRLWGDPSVTRYISAKGFFRKSEIAERLSLEIKNSKLFGVSYWPVFLKASGGFAGCIGLRPYPRGLEFGVHLLPKYWGVSLAAEGGLQVLAYAGKAFPETDIYAGHHPENVKSANMLKKIGFKFTHYELYPPTGLMHPTYIIERHKKPRQTHEAFDVTV